MKAWVYEPDREDGTGVYLFLEDVETPRPGPRDLLLRIEKVSVCGTDDTLFAGKLSRAVPGIVPGHEFCGEIVEVGAQAGDFQVGQRVAGESHYRRPGGLDEGVIGLWPPKMPEGASTPPVQGAYAEYAAIPAECAHVLPDQLANGRFWPSLFEPAGNDYLLARVVTERCAPRSVAVFGCGPHGLYAQIFLRHLGVEHITAFEIDGFRRRFARDLGCAGRVLDPTRDLEPLAGGFDAAIDMVGKQGQVFESCCRAVRDGGLVVLFGLFGGDTEVAGRRGNDIIFGREQLEHETDGKRIAVVGVTGREGIWEGLISSVAASPELQERLMRPVTVIGALDLLGQDARTHQTNVLKRAFSAFE